MGLLSGVAGIAGGPVAGFVVQHWRGIAFIVMLIVIVGSAYYYVWDLKNQIENLTETNVTLQQKIELCEEGRQSLKNAIKEQNKQIEEYERKGKIAAGQVAQANKDAAVIGKAYAISLEKLLKQPRPKGCAESIEYLKDRTDLQWNKK